MDKWINVNEKLPNENTDCIVYMASRNSVMVCKFFKEFTIVSMPNFMKPPITHWMPLPNPPK
jgi:hypothetical protein